MSGGEVDSLTNLTKELADFAAARDWERFHEPKNLLLALVGEVGELSEIFQWLTATEALAVTDGAGREAVEDELADVLIYLVRLAAVLDVDLITAVEQKMTKNAMKYPARVDDSKLKGRILDDDRQ